MGDEIEDLDLFIYEYMLKRRDVLELNRLLDEERDPNEIMRLQEELERLEQELDKASYTIHSTEESYNKLVEIEKEIQDIYSPELDFRYQEALEEKNKRDVRKARLDLEKEFIGCDKAFEALKQCKTYTVKKKDLEDVLDEEFGNYNADILYINEDIEDVTVMEGIDVQGNKEILYYYPYKDYTGEQTMVRQIRTFNENGDIVSMKRGQMKFNDEGLSEYDDIDSGSIVYKYDENGKKAVGLYVDDLIGAKYFEYDEDGKIKLSISEESVEQHIKDGEKNYTICDGYFEPTDNGYRGLPAKSMQEVEENEIKRYVLGDISKEEKEQIIKELTPERQKRVLDILIEMEPLLEYCNTYNSLDTERREEVIDDLGGVFEKLEGTDKIDEATKKAIEQYTGYSFEQFISETKNGFKRPKIVMGDGVSMSVQASSFHYCEPRRSGLDSYESYEVGYPSEVIEQLRGYEETPVENDEELLESIYPFVPAEILSQIVMEHGGIDKEKTLHPEKKLAGYKEEKNGMQSKNQKAADLINQLMAQIGNALEDYGKDEQE